MKDIIHKHEDTDGYYILVILWVLLNIGCKVLETGKLQVALKHEFKNLAYIKSKGIR